MCTALMDPAHLAASSLIRGPDLRTEECSRLIANSCPLSLIGFVCLQFHYEAFVRHSFVRLDETEESALIRRRLGRSTRVVGAIIRCVSVIIWARCLALCTLARACLVVCEGSALRLMAEIKQASVKFGLVRVPHRSHNTFGLNFIFA